MPCLKKDDPAKNTNLQLQIETAKDALGNGVELVKFCKQLADEGHVFQSGDRVCRENENVLDAFSSVQENLQKVEKASRDLHQALNGYAISNGKQCKRMPILKALHIFASMKNTQHLKGMQSAAHELLQALTDTTKKKIEKDSPEAKLVQKGMSNFFVRSCNSSEEFNLRKDMQGDSKEERYVFGVVLEPTDGSDGYSEKPDADNDVYSAEEVRKAAHWYMENGRQFGIVHGSEYGGIIFPEETEKIVLLENYITPQEIEAGFFGENSPMVRKGTWLMGLRINDNSIWNAIKSGEFNGFSIGGVAREFPVEEATE